MNKKILSILEFDKIVSQISARTVTDMGREEAEKVEPSQDWSTIQNGLNETEDGMKLNRLRGGIPVAQLSNIRPHIKRIEIGGVLNGLEIAQIGRVLKTALEIEKFFFDLKEAEISLNRLYHWSDQLVTLPEITKKIRESIEEDGRVTDEASQELKQLRQQIRRSEQSIREQLDGMIRGKQAKYLSDAIITMRNERYVIPVKQEYRSIFGGVVHDQSSSGQTLFVEPKQVVELNNRLRQHQIAERQEIERILAELSEALLPHRYEILQNAFLLGKLDFIQGKASVAKEMKGTIPEISQENYVVLRQARHPLISTEQVVPNDIILGKDYQAIVITGPNTGGKTITLKTLGLLQLMAQSGMAIPVAEESTIGIFTEIFADIGDEQSIEQSLSTFSSHMTNIVEILEKMDDRSLILFDELGAGTDPQEGAALAISILDKIGQTEAYVMATTHYPELKVYGYNRAGTINASMEFNVDTLRPTYRLLIGIPGRSNAFEISQRLGLQQDVIDEARLIVDGESQDLNEMISDLESRRNMAETEYLEMRRYVEESEKLYHDLEEAYRYFFQEREKELENGRKKANEVVQKAEEEAEKIITSIRKKQLSMGQAGGVKEHELIDTKKQLADLHQRENHLEKNKVLRKAKEQKKLKEGDEVLVETYGQRGILIKKMKNEQWQVQLGILKMTVSEDDIRVVKEEQQATHIQKNVATIRSASSSHVPSQLDLRGKRYEEALQEVDQYLDAAILAGYPQVTIVHGKGTGALRQGITDYLKQHSSVKKFEFAPGNQGGNGATIVAFK